MDYEIGNAVKTETRSEINTSYDGTGKYIPYCLCTLWQGQQQKSNGEETSQLCIVL